MNEKQIREVELRKSAYGYAQELALGRTPDLIGGLPSQPDAKSVVAEAKIIHEYLYKGK